MADTKTPEGRDYHSNVTDLAREEQSDIEATAKKIPADHSEQKTTRSTEGTVERTTSDTPRKS